MGAPVSVLRRRVADDATPVEDYAAARRWLWANVSPAYMADWLEGLAVAPPSARLICDMFWIGEPQLRADLSKEWRGDSLGLSR